MICTLIGLQLGGLQKNTTFGASSSNTNLSQTGTALGGGLKLGGGLSTITTQAGLGGGLSASGGLALQGGKTAAVTQSAVTTSTSFRGLGGVDPNTAAGKNGGNDGCVT